MDATISAPANVTALPTPPDYYAYAAQTLREMARLDFSELEYAVLIQLLLKSYLRMRDKAPIPKQRHLAEITGLDEPKISRVLARLKEARVIEEPTNGFYLFLPTTLWQVYKKVPGEPRPKDKIGVRFDWSAAAMATDCWLDLEPAHRELFPEPPDLNEAMRSLQLSSQPTLCRPGGERSGPDVMSGASGAMPGVSSPWLSGTEAEQSASVLESTNTSSGTLSDTWSPADRQRLPIKEADKGTSPPSTIHHPSPSPGRIGPIVPMPRAGVDLAPSDLAEKATLAHLATPPEVAKKASSTGNASICTGFIELPKKQLLPPHPPLKVHSLEALALLTCEPFKERAPLAHSATFSIDDLSREEASAILERGIPPELLNRLIESGETAQLVELERRAGLPEPPRPITCSETTERQLLKRMREILGERTMKNFGGYWRKRIWWKPSKIERVLNAVAEDQHDATRTVRNAGGHARYCWYLFAG